MERLAASYTLKDFQARKLESLSKVYVAFMVFLTSTSEGVTEVMRLP